MGEDPDQTRADETVGYLVLEGGSGTLGATTYVAGIGGIRCKEWTMRRRSYGLIGLATAGRPSCHGWQ